MDAAPQALNQPFRDLLDESGKLPADMLALLRRIVAYDPLLVVNLDSRYAAAWREGQELPEGRAVLQALVAYVGAQRRKELDAAPAAHL